MIIIKNAEVIWAWMHGMSNLPILRDISRDFQTGWEVAGDLFAERSEAFYDRDTSLIWTEDSNLRYPTNVSFAWRRDSLEAKLQPLFGARKMKDASRFLDYVETYRSLAAREMRYTRIPASIKLAQGILESNAGGSYLARSTNNHFGIKCRQKPDSRRDGVLSDRDFYYDALAIDCFQQADDHEWDRFEVYADVRDSYRRHSQLLSQNDRYRWMIDAYHPGQDYEVAERWFGRRLTPYYAAWAIGLKENGYATSKRYAQKLAYIIETYELWRIDYEVVFAVT